MYTRPPQPNCVRYIGFCLPVPFLCITVFLFILGVADPFITDFLLGFSALVFVMGLCMFFFIPRAKKQYYQPQPGSYFQQGPTQPGPAFQPRQQPPVRPQSIPYPPTSSVPGQQGMFPPDANSGIYTSPDPASLPLIHHESTIGKVIRPRYCELCGEEIQVGDKYCRSCGAEIPEA
jgi:hypothetical protein